jgi:hypothetical protein
MTKMRADIDSGEIRTIFDFFIGDRFVFGWNQVRRRSHFELVLRNCSTVVQRFFPFNRYGLRRFCSQVGFPRSFWWPCARDNLHRLGPSSMLINGIKIQENQNDSLVRPIFDVRILETWLAGETPFLIASSSFIRPVKSRFLLIYIRKLNYECSNGERGDKLVLISSHCKSQIAIREWHFLDWFKVKRLNNLPPTRGSITTTSLTHMGEYLPQPY